MEFLDPSSFSSCGCSSESESSEDAYWAINYPSQQRLMEKKSTKECWVTAVQSTNSVFHQISQRKSRYEPKPRVSYDIQAVPLPEFPSSPTLTLPTPPCNPIEGLTVSPQQQEEVHSVSLTEQGNWNYSEVNYLSLLEALEQLPSKVHLKHNFSGYNFTSNRQNSELSLKQKQQNHKLTKLKLAYSKRKKRLKKQLDSFDSVDSMAYPSNDEDQKLSCKEVCFGKRAKKWAFWFIVAFLAALTVKDVIALFIEYFEDPKQSDMNIVFNESMTMPNITFCMSRSQAWSHFRLNSSESPEEWDAHIQDELLNMTDKKAFLSAAWDYRMVMELYNMISSLTSMERETTLEGSANTIQKFGKQERFSTLRKNLKMWIDVIKDLDVSFEELTQKVGRETLRRSMQRFQRTSYNEDEVIKTMIRISWISQMQLCFQPLFDTENFKTIDDQGNFFTMVLSHNAEKLDNMQVECMSIDFHGRPSSNSRFSGHKGQSRDGFNDELCMGMVHETTVEVKARYKMLENEEQGTACKEHEEGEDNEFDCYARCRMEFIKKMCECTAPTLSYLVTEDELKSAPLCDYSNCEINVQTSNYSDDGCTNKCRRDCDQIRFEIDHEKKGKSVRPDLTTIYLLWGSFEYLTLEQEWKWSISSFIAALGGSIGMWLGLSILSLIQGGTYMYQVVHENVINKKKSRQISTATPASVQAKVSAAHSNANVEQPLDEDGNSMGIPPKNPFASPFKAPKHSTAGQAPPRYE